MSANSVRAVFFDAGNTLIYPRAAELAEDLTRRGYPATVEDFAAAERAGKARLEEWLWPLIRRREFPPKADQRYWLAYLKSLVERIGAPEGEHDRLMLGLAERFRDITIWSRVFPETAEVLERLRAEGYYLGVISNSIGTIAEQLERVGLAKYFENIIDSALVGVEKPNPEIFRMALKRAGFEADQAAFVGDTHATDVGGAEAAGLRGILLDRVGAYPNVSCPRITSLDPLNGKLAF